MMTGAYSPLHELSGEERKVFEKAMHGWVGVKYEPLLAATQLVAGTNYCFICNATPVIPNPYTYPAKVVIFAPLPGQGDPHITDITHI